MKQRVFLISVALLLVSTVVMGLWPARAQAVSATQITESDIKTRTTLKWINHAVIEAQVGSVTLDFLGTKTFDRNDLVDNAYVYKVQNFDCFGQIKLKSNQGSSDPSFTPDITTGYLDLDYKPSGGAGTAKCQNVGGGGSSLKFPLGSQPNFDIRYYVVPGDPAQKQINRVDLPQDQLGSWSFVLVPPENGVPLGTYLRNGETNSNSCQDRLLRNGDTYEMYEMQVDSNGHQVTDNVGLPSGEKCYFAHPGNTGSAGVESGKPGQRLGLETAGSSTPGSISPTSGGGAVAASCHTRLTDPLTWFICPLSEAANKAVEQLDSAISHELVLKSDEFFNENDQSPQSPGTNFFKIWSGVRYLALGVLTIIGLMMVISQAIGIGPFDAYTVKKLMPRLLVAAILITLSWDLGKLTIDIVNNIGFGVRALIYAPFADPHVLDDIHNIFASGSAQLVGSLGLAGLGIFAAFGGLSVLGVLSFALTALLAVLIALMLLIFRRIAIVLLMVLSPIAIACYILPNTKKAWDLWWDSFSGALMMFPILVAFISAGRVVAYVSVKTEPGLLGAIAAFVSYFGPYFLIPATFRLAGGALASVGGVINNRSKGLFDRNKKFRSAQAKRTRENIAAGKKFAGGTDTNLRGRMNRALQTGTLMGQAGLDPRKWRGRTRAARSARTSALSAEAEKSVAVKAVLGNDDLLAASLHGRGTEDDARAYLESIGQRGNELDQNVGSIVQARRDMGYEAYQDFAAANLAGTGTGYRSGPAEMLETINRVAGNDRARAARILNSARSQAERARRGDLYGAGFATSADQMTQLYRGQTTAAAVNEVMTDESLNTKSAAELGTSRNNALVNMVPAVLRRMANADYGVTQAQSALASAQAGGNPASIAAAQATLDTATHDQKRIYAHTASFLDIAGSAAPENAQVIGALMGQHTGGATAERYVTRQATDLNGNPAVDSTTNMPVMETVGVGSRAETWGDAMERMRSDPEFQQYRREYGNAAQAAAAAAAGAPPPGAAGGGGGAGGGAGGVSDRRLKKNIHYLQMVNGIKLYRFQYIWSSTVYVGVMAQDLLESHPEAVTKDKFGFYRVDYNVLGLEMMTWDEWLAHSTSRAS